MAFIILETSWHVHSEKFERYAQKRLRERIKLVIFLPLKLTGKNQDGN